MSLERPSGSRTESKEEMVCTQYLKALGLSVESLRGKRIVDVGAGRGEFVRFINAHGGTAVGLDIGNLLTPQDELEIGTIGTTFVVGAAEQMPFPDNSFDLVVSHAAIPNIASRKFQEGDVRRPWKEQDAEDQQRRIAALREMLRIVTPLGEVRCGPIVNSEQYVHQSSQIAAAIRAIESEAEIIREDIDNSSYLLILKKRV